MISTQSTLDGLILTSGSNGGVEAVIATVEKNNAIGKIRVASFDQPSNMTEGFEKGILAGVAGGTFGDPLFSFIVMANYLQGNPLSEDPIGLNANYIFVRTAEEAKDFMQYVDSPDAQIYSAEEIQQMTKKHNSSFTLEELEKIVAAYSLEDIKARNS